MNEKFKDITDEALKALAEEKKAAFDALTALTAPTLAQVQEASALADERDEIDTEVAAREAAAVEAGAAFEALKARKFGAEKEEASEAPAEDAEAEDGDEEDEEAAEEAPAEEAPAEATVTHIDTAKIKTVAALARRTKRPAVPEEGGKVISMIAAADNGFAAGKSLNWNEVGQAAVNRLKGMPAPTGNGESEELQTFGVAALEIPFDDEFVIDHRTSDESASEIMNRASDETRLPGESLTAANGWCSPSEILYDLAADESLEGILSLPEVQVRRGGIRFTPGPQFADFYANAGFIQTEAQAIAGTAKPCYEVSCPTFTDVRLDAVGVCIKVPILLNAAYPEMVNRFTSGTLIAHQHMVNANVIGRMVTASGAARVFAGLGSAISDSLEGLSLVADQRRQNQRLALNRTVEVVVPFWTKNVYLNDMGRRTGLSGSDANEAALNAFLSGRGLNVNYVYDWQVIDETAEVYPTTYNALVYPAGTFIKGVSQVINLSAVYDAASLAVNTYTGLFMEQGVLVAKKQYGSDLVTLPICAAGRTGAANLTCA